ncbi:MAG: FmdB family zinc ribbon protein [Moorellales bacterium]
MPTYDFRCRRCGQQFSRFTTIEGRKQVTCPNCASPEVQQLLTGFFYSRPNGGNGAGSCSRTSCRGCSGC